MTSARRVILQAGLAALISCSAMAQDPGSSFPDKPIRIVVGWAPGGSADAFLRNIYVDLAKQLGVSVVIENRPGANGTIAHALVARAPADGYTLILATNSTTAIGEHLYKNLPYRHEKDLAPISLMGRNQLIMTVTSALPVKNVADFIKLARQKPGAIDFATGGNGSTSHLATELFQQLTDTKMTHVPYKGGGSSVTALASGQIHMAFLGDVAAAPQLASGRIRAIAVTGKNRLASMPDVPTMIEAGVPNFESITTFELYAPTGTPARVVDKINSAVVATLRDKEVANRLAQHSVEVIASSPQELRSFTARESAKWGDIIRTRNLILD
ncbi:tripartite tricarboxylate transporter substrate binding protein [Hydrogenophaga sp.]|uniref:Bug family tripartite tricarboxylate transporter substrate binding protein n=1 Tax=Hydrogenophaga sp. TaxID=1904254 RepID=UPI00272481C9|nr:tripartite tricarboxylate transporter substrate binding protein [Hydrogenophaga sp.]MDO9438871.1 tripartite tricarboxylate transporter substrate binding protein [Hydrogenophaga sp.]